jgi:hypothetical protein
MLTKMRQLLIILCTLITVGGFAQINRNSAVLSYKSLAEAVKHPKDVDYKFDVFENGVTRHFVVAPRSLYTPDSVMVVAMADSVNVAIIDGQAIMPEYFKKANEKDWYNAFQRMFRYINLRKGNIIVNFKPNAIYNIDTNRVFGPLVDTFTYYVIDTISNNSTTDTLGNGIGQDTIKIDTSIVKRLDTLSNNILNMELRGVSNVIFRGNGATISVKGNFTRKTTRTLHNGGWKVSNYNQVCPLVFTDSKNITIENLTVDGHVQQMKQDSLPGYLIEGDNYGLKIQSCDNVTVSNSTFKDFATDGILVDISSTTKNKTYHASNNVVFNQVHSVYNGRLALFMGNVWNFQCNQCDLSHTNDSLGTYPGHGPGKGVDIEPVRYYGVATLGIDSMTQNIWFNNCSFVDNFGGVLSSVISSTVKDVYFNGGIMDNRKYNNNYMLIMGTNNMVVDNVDMWAGTGCIYTSWSTGLGQKSTIKNSRLHAKGQGIIGAVNGQYGAYIDHNEMWEEADSALKGYFLYINRGVWSFTNNTLHYGHKAYGGFNKIMLQGISNVRDNFYQTDIKHTDSLVAVTYSFSKNVSDHFLDSSIRSYTSPSWAGDYTTGDVSIGSRQIADNGNGLPNITTSGTGIPTTGKYNMGDLVKMRNPLSAGFWAYGCTASGDAALGTAQFQGLIPISTAGPLAYKTGFVKDITSNSLYVGQSLKLQNDINRLLSTVAYPDSAMYTTGAVNDTGIVLFKIPGGFTSAAFITADGMIATTGKGAVRFTINTRLLNSNTFFSPTLNIEGDSSLIGTKVRLLKDAGNNAYIAFFDVGSVLASKTTIQFRSYTLAGTGGAAITNAAVSWSTQLVTSLTGYTVMNTLVNSSGANWNYITNKPTGMVTSLTTNGVSGTSTLSNGVLNIPVIPTSFWQRTGTTTRLLNTGDNLTVDGKLKVGSMPTGTTAMKYVVWNTSDSSFNTVSGVGTSAIDQTYSGTFTSDGTTASSPANLKYTWSSDGKITTLKMRLKWNTPSSTMTTLSFPLPNDCPAPAIPSDVTGDNQIITAGNIVLQPSNNASLTLTDNTKLVLKRLAASSSGFQLEADGSSFSYQGLFITITYQNQ